MLTLPTTLTVLLLAGQKLDPETDRLIVVSSGGPAEDAPVLMNGSTNPQPIEYVCRPHRSFRK